MLPKWARAYHIKYYNTKESEDEMDSEGDDEEKEKEDKATDNTDKESANAETTSGEESDLEDMDADPRAKRAENAFYQNPDDQLHLRDIDDNDDAEPLDQYANLVEKSNPSGADWMAWAKGNTFPSYSTIIGRLNDLKKLKAKPDIIRNVSLNEIKIIPSQTLCTT